MESHIQINDKNTTANFI